MTARKCSPRKTASPQGPLYDVTVHQTVTVREIRIDAVPPENVIVSADAESVEKARFIACWQLRTASELVSEGYPRALIEELEPADGADEMPETAVGRAVNDAFGPVRGEGRGAAREYRIYEAWFDFDLDGDGLDER